MGPVRPCYDRWRSGVNVRRRDFLRIAGSVALATLTPATVRAQLAGRLPRVAVVTSGVIPDITSAAGKAAFDNSSSWNVFIPEMARLGFVDGQTISFERYSAPPAVARQIANAIVASKP